MFEREEFMVGLMADYCSSCWTNDPRCQCGNDE